MKIIRRFILVSLVFANQAAARGPEEQTAASETEIRKHLIFLADDSLQGRETGSRGEYLAATYIADQLSSLGLDPMGTHGLYFQYIPIHASYPSAGAQIFLFGTSGVESLRIFSDFMLVKSGAQTLIPSPTAMVFCGYGIIAPEFEYNDYQSIDVAGKIAVFLTGEPPSVDPTFFDGPYPTIYSTCEAKIRTAMSRGAVGSILIRHPQDESFKSWESLVADFSFPDMTLADAVSGHFSIIVPSTVGAMLFPGSAHSWSEILRFDLEGGLPAFPLVTMLSFQQECFQRDFWARNVLARLPGLQDAEHYIILSAHYDHLGVGRAVAGDSIYNGAVDNGLGTAGLLELARMFSRCAQKPRCSILFAFFTGEEKGLLGSRYYVNHPVVPLYKTLANINIDGLAMFEAFEDIVGLGAELSSLEESMRSVARQSGLEVSPLPPELDVFDAYALSDQMAFAEAGVPAVLTIEGLKSPNHTQEEMLQRRLQWSEKVYHSPFDDLNQPISFSAAAQHLNFIYLLARELAYDDQAPEWKRGVPYKSARLRSRAQKW